MAEAFEALLRREHPQLVITFDSNIRPSVIKDEPAVRVRRALGQVLELGDRRVGECAAAAGGVEVDAGSQSRVGVSRR
ncbi:hypothetical protein F0L68_08280 [Solihabitans fulvus]|uniref:Uncharacterized protein n=1 Tax=Solihabitans fulvus TaxID=1892852 RepID=A0A5B2XM69_9PSEU|nr:hypothetical protein [Solihabitans fulvus]KAA2264225.1 hypothetical protein F0L68_08280 [Solihabitans fulvus]